MADIWVVGSGAMGFAYAQVLSNLKINYLVIGKHITKSSAFEKLEPNRIIGGGTEKALIDSNESPPDSAIIALPIYMIIDETIKLIKKGTKRVLIEKPGALFRSDLERLKEVSEEYNAEVFLAYNRRFYNSTYIAQKTLKEDGGPTSIHFEFSELSDKVAQTDHPQDIKSRWFLANSTHVIDLAFWLAGKPLSFHSSTFGKLNWHEPSIFVGSGTTDQNCLFSYNSNWDSAGRWFIEVKSKNKSLKFSPLETLSICKRGTFDWVKIDDEINDINFKPGIYKQTESFLLKEDESFCTLDDQIIMWDTYVKMSGYED